MAGERPLLVCGTGSFAEEVADLVSETPGYRVAAFVENLERSRCDETLAGLPIVWVDALPDLAGSHWAVCAIGSTKRSRFTGEVEEHAVPFATIVHPGARISATGSIGEGSIASAGVVVGARTAIGRHAILNRGVLVGHHTTLGDHVSLLPGANVAGRCRIGHSAYVGMGAIVLNDLEIGRDAVVAAGAVVTADVADAAVVMGVPARVVPDARGPR